MSAGPASQQSLGVFQGWTGSEAGATGVISWGEGGVAYDEDGGEYRLEWAGAIRCAYPEDIHLVWRRLRGDFIVRARTGFESNGVDPHRNLGWLARESLVSGSPWVKLAVYGNGMATLLRGPGDASGGADMALWSSVKRPTVVQLARRGTTFSMAVARFGEPFGREELVAADLGDEIYVGLFVCSRDTDPLSGRALFRNVRIVEPAPDDLVPYQDYLGSHLEILDVVTGQRQIVHSVVDSLQAPNWTPDGEALIYNRNGRLYRFELGSGEVAALDTGFATNNNNDHVLSFDGQRIGISHHPSERDGESIIYTLPSSGGTPRQVTPTGPSYLHGWSPDGRWLIYTAERDGDYDIYRIGVNGGPEERLTDSPGLDDGSEYSPDGRYIYFNSVRSGSMEIWRMRPDGRQPEQLTDDELNNWFPHVSPDGCWIAFLSYGPDVDPGDHPFYQEVYLRLIPADGGEAKVVAYLYGGQGTLNVPSWAPDSRRLAFVSNTGGL